MKKGQPTVELACGPGMGLIPSIKWLNPLHICMATDANSLLINQWRQYTSENEGIDKLDFAQFSLLDIPFKDNSVLAYSSYIGISSTRNGDKGYDKALSEIYRTLKQGGYVYTIENEWTNITQILELFKLMNKEPWNIFLEPQKSWHQRFKDAGFEILYEDVVEYRKFSADDNELGEAAVKYGKDVGIKTIGYILRKNN